MEVHMIITIAITAGILVAALLAAAAAKPGTFRIQRTKTIQASPERVFVLIDNFRQWDSWSPWEKLDPAMKRTFSGAERGQGAVYEWCSKGKAGQGRMEIMDTVAPSRVAIKLDFLKPFEGHNMAEFRLDRDGDSTHVTWTMYGPHRYMCKLMSMFFNMDKIIGREFETGLANIKSIAEERSQYVDRRSVLCS
jgi:uncharacterized protein YndB with AHSA1/START domain